MKNGIRMIGLLLITCMIAGGMQTADAQILRRAKEKLRQQVEQRAAEEAEDAAEEAVEEAAEAAAEDAVESAVRNSGASMGGGSSRPAAAGDPVDFRELKALLPASLPGLKRSEATGQRSSALGIK